MYLYACLYFRGRDEGNCVTFQIIGREVFKRTPCTSERLTNGENCTKVFYDVLIKTSGGCKSRDDSVSMRNRERFFDVGRHVVVVEASRYWNFYEGVLIGNGEGGSKGGSCPEWNSFSRIRPVTTWGF